MKRTRPLLLVLALILLSALFLFSACGDENEKTDAASEYTVIFSVNGTETKVTVPAGEIPEYTGETSWETPEHFCKITGWEPALAPATANVTYTAIVGEYGLTLYKIRFNMKGDASEMVTVETHEGEIPTPPAGYETDLSKPGKVGTFDHWTPEMVAPTAENMEGKKVMVYTPVYTYKAGIYTITFNVKGKEYKVETKGNTVPVCPVDPAASETATDKFAGWDALIVPAVKDATYTAFYGSTTEIAPAKDGAKSILTMTYDRNTTNPSQSEWVLRMHDTYGIRGTNMLIVGRLNTTMTEGWKKNFARGTLDAGSLGMKHESARIETTQAIYQNEIVDSKYLIEKLFPDQNAICFASPYAQLRDFSYAENPDGTPDKTKKIYDGGSKKIARETYYAVRNGTLGLNTLDPGCTEEAGGWYNLMVQWFYNNNTRGQTVAERAGWIDNAVQKGGWLLILGHDFLGTADDDLSITEAEGEAFYKHASTYIQSGELWAATFVEATKYIRERQSATAYRHMENGVLTLGLKIDRTTPDGKPLDESIFNYPLTIKARVPAGWNSASYELNGKTVTANAFTDPVNNQKYVLVNVVPGGDGAVSTVTVTRVN